METVEQCFANEEMEGEIKVVKQVCYRITCNDYERKKCVWK